MAEAAAMRTHAAAALCRGRRQYAAWQRETARRGGCWLTESTNKAIRATVIEDSLYLLHGLWAHGVREQVMTRQPAVAKSLTVPWPITRLAPAPGEQIVDYHQHWWR